MSGWHSADKYSHHGTEFKSTNVLTMGGKLPSDKIPSGQPSGNIVEAHFKSLRCFRRWCRFMPFIMFKNGMQAYTNPEQAKLHLAQLWRQYDKVGRPEDIDDAVAKMYERLYNIHNQDVWGTFITDHIAYTDQNMPIFKYGYSTLEEDKNEGKTEFMNEFINGKKTRTPY